MSSPENTDTHALDEALERLYAVFGERPAPRSTQYSPDAGITAEQARRLHAKPLRELSKRDLDRYARSALTTWGDVDDFKHFLPRIFELIARHPGWGDAVMFESLSRAQWDGWPQRERDAVRRFLEALWERALEAGPDVIDAAMVLRGIGLAGCDVRAFLDVWRRVARGRRNRSPTSSRWSNATS